MSTIKDVAAQAGVSVGTVSNYITGARFVHPETAKLIKRAIDALDYHPNPYAKNLRAKTNQEIAVILPNVYDQYYSFILAGIEKELRQYGFYLNIGLTDDVPETEMEILETLIKKCPRGLIVVSCLGDRTVYEKIASFPTVFIDRSVTVSEVNFITSNIEETLTFLLSQLYIKKTRDVALITGPDYLTNEKVSTKAYLDFFRQKNRKEDSLLLRHIKVTKEEAFRTGIELLTKNHPQAIICTSRTIANGIEQAAAITGLSLHKDITLISFGQENWNNNIAASGTINTMRPAHLIGKKAARLLISNINSPLVFEKQHIILKDKIIEKPLFSETEKLKRRNRGHELKLLMLNSPNANTFIQTSADFFRKTGIKINVTVCEHSMLLDKLRDKKVLSEYDVIEYDNPWQEILADDDCLMDISKFVRSDDFNKSGFIDGLIEKAGMIDNRYYGIPLNFGPQLLLYRKDIFENQKLSTLFEQQFRAKFEIPKTWFEFNVISSFLTHAFNPSSPVQYGTSIAAGNEVVMIPELMPRIWAYGGSIFDSSGNVAVTSSGFIKGLTNFINTFRYADPQSINFGAEQTIEDFCSGKTGMLVSYTSFIGDVNNLSKSDVVGKFGFANIPGKLSILGCWCLGISKWCSQPKDAFEFLRWSCDKDMSTFFGILNGQSPLKDTYDNDELINHFPWLPLAYHSYPNNRQRKSLRKNDGTLIPITGVESIVYRCVTDILQQNSSIEDAVKRLKHDIENQWF